MTIEINLQKLIGTTKTKVPVRRKTGTTLEYRRTGRKSPRAGTGKIDKLPQNIRDTIIELRNLNYSGSQIKDHIEPLLDAFEPEIRQKLVDANVITRIGAKLTVTPQALTDYAKKHGAKPTSVRGPKSAVEVQAKEKALHETTKKQLSESDKKVAELGRELQDVKDRIEANKIDAKNKEKIRDKLRTDLTTCQAKLGGK